MEEALAAELPGGSARVIGTADLTWDMLVERIAGGSSSPDPVTARLALRVAAERAGGLGGAAATRGFLSSAARFVAEAERAGVPPAELPVGPRAEGLLRLYREVARLRSRVGLSLDARRAAGLRTLPPLGVGGLDIQPRLDWEPADVALVVALAREVPVRVRLPWAAGRPAIYGGLEAILAAFEKQSDLDQLDLVLEDPADGPRAARSLVAALYYGEAPPPKRRTTSVLAAPHPLAELRAIAAHVRRLVDGGAAPETIAVAVRAPGAAGRVLAEELGRVGLALDDRRGPPLAAAPPARLALMLVTLADGGFAREDVLEILGSRYVEHSVPAHAVAKVARALGLRRFDADGIARLARAPGGERLGAAVRALLEPLATLPAIASLADHATALRRLLVTLGIDRRARAFDRALASAGAPGVRIERALARDQAAIAALEGLLDRLPRAAAAAQLTRAVTRAELAQILGDLAAEVPLRAHGVRGGAVRLLHLADLASRRFDHVILPGLVEGLAPLASGDDGVYGERERRALNRALGVWALPSFRAAVGPDDPLPAERTPYETLMLVCAVAAARRTVLLSYAETVDGRAVARSPFLDEVLRAAPWIEPERVPLAPIPALGDAAAPADILARVALESWADPAGRMPPRPADPAAGVWLSALQGELPDRVARVEALAAIEKRRWRYFAREEPPNPWVGAVARDFGLGGPEAPIPARQLELLANCPFSFLAARLLGVAPPDEAEDAPSALRVGRLAHRCLETFYRRALAGAATDRPALEAACAAVFAEAEVEGTTGHRRLWELTRAKLVDDLWRVVLAELPWDGTPVELELAFGVPGADLPALLIGGVHVSGRIDRVDRSGAGHVVVDYKLGGKAAQQAKLRVAGDTQLQLPIYAALVRAQYGGAVDAGFISLKDAAARTLGAERTAELVESVLPERLAALGDRVRSGTFEIAPVECRGCDFRTVCRVVHLNEADEP